MTAIAVVVSLMGVAATVRSASAETTEEDVPAEPALELSSPESSVAPSPAPSEEGETASASRPAPEVAAPAQPSPPAVLAMTGRTTTMLLAVALLLLGLGGSTRILADRIARRTVPVS
ncbi:MAG: hypothetical protein RIB98_00035 [Acidimicrobiales bacterium]